MAATASPDGQTAILFPGQGSQADGMRELVAEHCPELLELALASYGGDPFAHAGESTAAAQPAIYCASLAHFARAGEPEAELFAGHSLGELTALAAAGAIEPGEGLRLALERGALMETAGRESPGGMVALIGDGEAARELAAACGLVIANDNNPGQLVASGPLEALDRAQMEAKAHGVRRAMVLPVAAAFHSPAMLSAVQPFRDRLEAAAIGVPARPVISCSTVAEHRLPSQIRDELADALVRPVRWRETVIELEARGATRFRETGPGRALAGMVKRTLDGVDIGPLEEPVRA